MEQEKGYIQFIFKGDYKDGLTKESKKAIRSILTILEELTNYEDLDPLQKRIVRSTVLDSVNNLRRTGILYIESSGVTNDKF